jgi:hypothetical protein
MVEVQTDGLKFVGRHIFASQRVVYTEKDEPPASLGLNLAYDFQDEERQAAADLLA